MNPFKNFSKSDLLILSIYISFNKQLNNSPLPLSTPNAYPKLHLLENFSKFLFLRIYFSIYLYKELIYSLAKSSYK